MASFVFHTKIVLNAETQTFRTEVLLMRYKYVKRNDIFVGICFQTAIAAGNHLHSSINVFFVRVMWFQQSTCHLSCSTSHDSGKGSCSVGVCSQKHCTFVLSVVTTFFASGWLASCKETVLAIRASWLAACFETGTYSVCSKILQVSFFLIQMLSLQSIIMLISVEAVTGVTALQFHGNSIWYPWLYKVPLGFKFGLGAPNIEGELNLLLRTMFFVEYLWTW